MGKTKIIATIGPSTQTKDKIKELIINGCDVLRINMSYSSYSFCEEMFKIIEEVNKELKTNVGIMLDTNGPDLRVENIKNDEAFLNKNDRIRIYKTKILGDETKFCVNYDNFVDELKCDNVISINDGDVELLVENKTEEYLLCEVIKPGKIYTKSGVHVKSVKLNVPFLSAKDKEDILFAHKNNIDFLAVSFVSSSEDILEINDILIELNNNHMGIIAKIEKESALEEIDEIIKSSDGIIISRGDLGIEVPLERIPGIQKSIINKCHMQGKISIVSTEMLSSMEDTIIPTKAEISDIANAVLDGVDAIILSSETTIGKYPIETLQMTEKVIVSSEENIDYLDMLDKAIRTENNDVTGGISYSVAELSSKLKCKAIVTPTVSGYTARKMSRFRPSCPIIAVSYNKDTVKSLSLYFGVFPVLINEMKTIDTMISVSRQISKEMLDLKENDKIIITGGYPFKESKHTNFMKIEEI